MLYIVISSRQAEIIPGFVVKRLLPYQLRRMIGPFIFLDHGGPVSIPTAIHSDLDVLPYPHIGLSTVSYLFSGEIMHRDSLGVEQAIKPGEVNWMTAGRGDRTNRVEFCHHLQIIPDLFHCPKLTQSLPAGFRQTLYHDKRVRQENNNFY